MTSISPHKSSSERVRIVLWVVGSVAAVALVIGMIVVVSAIYDLTKELDDTTTAVRETQVANTERAKLDRDRDERTAATAADSARAAERIEDCTTPGRECFDESQERLADTVGNVNRYALAAAYCADQPGTQTISELEECIRAAVRTQRASAGPR